MFISFCSPCLGFIRLLKCMDEFCASEMVSTWYKHQLMNCLHRIDPLASSWGHFLDWYRRAPNTVGSAVPGQAARGCSEKANWVCRGEWARKRRTISRSYGAFRGFSWWWTIACWPNDPFPTPVPFGHGMYQSNRNPTRKWCFSLFWKVCSPLPSSTAFSLFSNYNLLSYI